MSSTEEAIHADGWGGELGRVYRQMWTAQKQIAVTRKRTYGETTKG